MALPARRAGRQAQVAGLLVTVALGGCANLAEPPGGPPDSTPPHIVLVRPESGAVVPAWKGDVVIQFDEVIDEMGGGGGGGSASGGVAGIGRQIVLSPVAGAVQASWHRRSISVKPSEGWKPGRVYHLEILPGITDLRRNVTKQGAMVIFSTGPALPHAAISGYALQWVEQHAIARAVIRAARLPDTVAYVTFADSTGAFHLTDVPSGRYRVTAIQDQNGNRQLDAREAFDSGTVTVDSTASIVLWAFPHDTTGPKLRTVEPIDSTALRLTFSQPLDPHRMLDTTNVRLFALPDTTPLALASVWNAAHYDSMQARARAITDSLRRAKDTTAHRDTTARPGAASPVAAAQRAPAAPGDTAPGRADTSHVRQLLQQRPVPIDHFVAVAAKPLAPGHKFLVRVRGAVNLNGAAADGQTVFEVPVPKPAPPGRDTARVRPAPAPSPPRPP